MRDLGTTVHTPRHSPPPVGQAKAGTTNAPMARREVGRIFPETPGCRSCLLTPGLLTPGLPSSAKSEKTLRSFSTLAMNFTPQPEWKMSFTNGRHESQLGMHRSQTWAWPRSRTCVLNNKSPSGHEEGFAITVCRGGGGDLEFS